jgi:hypothetical protein
MGFIILFLNVIGGIFDFLFFGDEALFPGRARRVPLIPLP